MIKSKDGFELKVGDIVSESYLNGWWFGIIEQPDFYAGTVTAIRILDGEGYFWDFKLNGVSYKHIFKDSDSEYTILNNVDKNKNAIDKKHCEYYRMRILAGRPGGIIVSLRA